MENKVKKMVMAALLTAMAIVIPVQFGFLKIVFGPFSATLGSHIPTMIAMLISPMVGVIVGIGSALGFFITTSPVIALRALMHAPVGYIGAKIVERDKNIVKALIITAPIHGILEGIAVLCFGANLYNFIVVVIIGTMLHHAMDSVITLALSKATAKARRKDIYSAFN